MTQAIYRFMPVGEPQPLRWSNGLGTTSELVRHPQDAAEVSAADPTFVFSFRSAPICALPVEGGPPNREVDFSPLPGIDRHLLVAQWDIEGIRLDHGANGSQDVTELFQVVSFSGDWVTKCVLAGDKALDFNLMVHRERARAVFLAHQFGAKDGAVELPLDADFHVLHFFSGNAHVALAGGAGMVHAAPHRTGETLYLMRDQSATAPAKLIFHPWGDPLVLIGVSVYLK